MERTQFGCGTLRLNGLLARYARGARGRGPGAGVGRCAGGVGRRLRVVALGFQALEFFQGAVVVAAGGIDAALETGEIVAAAGEGLAQEALLFRFPDFPDFRLPELSFGLAEAAE